MQRSFSNTFCENAADPQGHPKGWSLGKKKHVANGCMDGMEWRCLASLHRRTCCLSCPFDLPRLKAELQTWLAQNLGRSLSDLSGKHPGNESLDQNFSGNYIMSYHVTMIQLSHAVPLVFPCAHQSPVRPLDPPKELPLTYTNWGQRALVQRLKA